DGERARAEDGEDDARELHASAAPRLRNGGGPRASSPPSRIVASSRCPPVALAATPLGLAVTPIVLTRDAARPAVTPIGPRWRRSRPPARRTGPQWRCSGPRWRPP